MFRLRAIEFLAANPDLPTLVRVARTSALAPQLPPTPLVGFVVLGWAGWLATPDDPRLEFATPGELVIEGGGLARPYWNDDLPTWAVEFDAHAEARRIEQTRAAALAKVREALVRSAPFN